MKEKNGRSDWEKGFKMREGHEQLSIAVAEKTYVKEGRKLLFLFNYTLILTLFKVPP